MRILSLIVLLLLSFTVHAGFEGLDQGVSLKLFNRIDCGSGLTCSKVKDKFTVVYSGQSGSASLQPRVAATATTITAAQCGSTFYNSGAVVINLPEASVVLGCRLTFVTMNASNFDVNPDNADQILVQTNAAGDAIRNATLGNSITLEAMSASQWAPVSVQGTWSDIN